MEAWYGWPNTSLPERRAAPLARKGLAGGGGYRASGQSSRFVLDIRRPRWRPDEGVFAVNDDNLAVIAEVELQARPPAPGASKGMALYPGLLKFLNILVRQLVGPELVEEKVNAHPGLRSFDECFFKAGAHLVALDDIEVDQDIVFRFRKGLEDALEDFVAVDEEVGVVATGDRHSAETDCGGQKGSGGLEAVGLDGGFEGIDLGVEKFVVGTSGVDITAQFVAPKDPIEWDGDPGEGDEANDPSNGAAGSAHPKKGVEDVGGPDEMEGDDAKDKKVF